jgi:hypothetical protein
MVHSPTSSTPSHESYAFDDVEDDDDTDVSSAAVEATGTYQWLDPQENCMIVYCFTGSDVVRTCGSKGVCHRCIPSAHKLMPETLTSHADEGWYLTLPPTKKGSQVLDGLVSSYRSDEDHQAALQRRTDENQVMARRLAETSPDNGRTFHDAEDDEDMVDETPLRTTKTPRFAQPPPSTQVRVPGVGTGSLAGASFTVPVRSGPMMRPARAPAASTDALASLTALVTESLKGHAALEEKLEASQRLVETLLANMSFQGQVDRAISAGTVAPVVTTIDDDSDGSSLQEHDSKAKSRKKVQHVDKKKRGKKGRSAKAPSTWYGVVAGQFGSVKSTLKNAKDYAHEFDPHGRVSSKFDTKAEAEKWVAKHKDDPDSSDTASAEDVSEDSGSDSDLNVKPKARKGGMIPPGRLPRSTELPFELVSQDPSSGKRELFGIEIKKEVEVLAALAPKNLTIEVQRSLAECIVDGTMLPGTSSEVFGNEENGGGENVGLAETLSRVIRSVRAVGDEAVDDGYESKRRISLVGVKNLEQLHTLEQELVQAIPREIENMRLHFGAKFTTLGLGWTDAQEMTYLMGGHFPFISLAIMRHYSDLVRNLAIRSTKVSWVRVKSDIDFFVEKLHAQRLNASTRFLAMIRTYIFLRNSSLTGFESIERMNSQLNDMAKRLDASSNMSNEADATSTSMCQTCKQKGLHHGGRTSCPFKAMAYASAKLAGTLAATFVRDGYTKKEAYQKAKLEIEEGE